MFLSSDRFGRLAGADVWRHIILSRGASHAGRDERRILNEDEQGSVAERRRVLGARFSKGARHHAKLEETAFDRPVEERDTARRSQTQQTGELQVGGEDVNGPPAVLLF